MKEFYRVDSPLKLQQTKKKNFILNLNHYRNTHYRVLNNMKILYKQKMKPQIATLPVFNRIIILFKVYPATRAKFDIANVCSVHDKFFCDALVEEGKLPDDNFEHITEVRYVMGNVDKDNPRVSIYIKPLKDN